MDMFRGIRVLDLASFVAAPAAATLLADMGADVIKVEPPAGDTWRNITPPDRPNAIWHLTSRNKRSVVLDLKSEAHRAVLQQMAEQCDVLLHNFRPSQAKAYGLSYEALRAGNPRLIYAYMNGFGDRGPEADRRAFDTTAYFARCGILHMMHDKGQAPPFPVIGLGDHFTAMTLFAGISAALFRREQTGEGCQVSTSLIATGVWGNGVQVQSALAGADPSAPRDEKGWTNPFGSVYRTADDRFLLFILANRVKEWPPLAEALGLAELLTDERFVTPAVIEANAAELKRLIAERIAGMTLAEVGPKLDASGAAWSEIRTLEQVTQDAQVLENGVIVSTPTGDDRIGHSIANPLRFNESAHVHRRDAPGLGEHTHEVLSEFGFDADAIDALKR